MSNASGQWLFKHFSNSKYACCGMPYHVFTVDVSAQRGVTAEEVEAEEAEAEEAEAAPSSVLTLSPSAVAAAVISPFSSPSAASSSHPSGMACM